VALWCIIFLPLSRERVDIAIFGKGRWSTGAKRASAWRRFMKAMVSWVKVSKEIEKELREIGKLRGEALPGGRQMREGLRGG
jgi:tRNA A-37 threonylcarbamoyl transferase component Bud32